MTDERLSEMARKVRALTLDVCPHYVSETGWRYGIYCDECCMALLRQVRDETADRVGDEILRRIARKENARSAE
jgi:hypothetical protein